MKHRNSVKFDSPLRRQRGRSSLLRRSVSPGVAFRTATATASTIVVAVDDHRKPIEQSQEVYVRVATRRGTTHLHLGRPTLAPYPSRCRTGTEALFAVLESDRLQMLLDSGGGELLIRAAQGSAHWSAAVSERRLRHALVQLG